MKTKRAMWTNAELFQIFLDCHVDGDNLKKYKVEELQEISHTLGLNVTGKKKDLINSIIEELYNQFFSKYVKMRNTSFLRSSAWTYCEKTNLNETFTRFIIRDMERGILVTKKSDKGSLCLKSDGSFGCVRKEEKIFIPFESYDACHNIINRGFINDPVYDDILQEVSLFLWKSFLNDSAYVLNGRIVFSNDNFERDYSSFREVYRVVSRTLSSFRLNKSQKKDVGEETVICSDNGDTEQIVKVGGKKDQMNLSTLIDYSMIEHGNDVDDFFRFISETYPKEANELKALVIGRFKGETDKEIAHKLNVSERTIDRRSALLKMAYQEYRAIDDSNRFIFNKERKESKIDKYSAVRPYSDSVDQVWKNSRDYSNLTVNYENRVIEKQLTYWERLQKSFESYYNTCYDSEIIYKYDRCSVGRKRLVSEAVDFGICMVAKQFPRLKMTDKRYLMYKYSDRIKNA